MRATDLLPDDTNHADAGGVTVRKGSVGAFLVNARVLADATASADARATAERDLIELVPALRALGLFEIFEIRDPALRALVETH